MHIVQLNGSCISLAWHYCMSRSYSEQVFIIVYLYTCMHYRWIYSHQEGRVGIRSSCLASLYVCACPKPGHGFPTSYFDVFFSFFFFVQLVEVRGNCSFYWYWWNCGPSLFKPSFHNYHWWGIYISYSSLNLPDVWITKV